MNRSPGAAQGQDTGPRLPYVDDAQLGTPGPLADAAVAIRARRAHGALLNLDRMLLHSPPFAAGWSALLGAIRGRLTLAPALRELAICAIARLNDASYEWQQHIGEWQAAGARPEQVEALQAAAESWPGAATFDTCEQQVLALVIQSTRHVQVDPALLAALEARLGRTATVELVGTVAAYNMVSRFLVALGVDAEGEQSTG